MNDGVVEVYRQPLFRFSSGLSEVAHRARHNSLIDAVHYIPCLDALLVVERNSGLVKLYDALTYELEHTILLPRGSPTAAHYIESMKAVVFCFGDTIMGVWDLNRESDTFKQMKRGLGGHTPICWPAAEVQLSLNWIPNHNLLYSGSRDGVVQAWNINERREVCVCVPTGAVHGENAKERGISSTTVEFFVFV
jgi:WD40 repeat protein